MPSGLVPGSVRGPGPEQSGATVSLRWQEVTGADEYDFGVRDMTSDRLVVDQRTGRGSYTTSLEPGKTYRWNIRACNAAGCSGYTAPLYFTTPDADPSSPSNNRSSSASSKPVISVPATPRGPTPGNRRSPGPVVSDITVRIDWRSVSGAEEYDFGLRDLTTNRLVVDERSRRSSYTANLRADRQYRWNVRACNSAGCSDFTAPLYFSTPRSGASSRSSSSSSSGSGAYTSVSNLDTPRGLSPGRSSSPGTTVNGTIVRIDWRDVDAADEYDFGIRDMTTNRLVVDDQSKRSSYTVRLKAGRTYRWNVRACNRSGCSDFSRPRYFTVAD